MQAGDFVRAISGPYLGMTGTIQGIYGPYCSVLFTASGLIRTVSHLQIRPETRTRELAEKRGIR